MSSSELKQTYLPASDGDPINWYKMLIDADEELIDLQYVGTCTLGF